LLENLRTSILILWKTERIFDELTIDFEMSIFVGGVFGMDKAFDWNP
jgi:hypothetical protein